MDCTVTPLKTLMGFSVHLNVQLKFYNLPNGKLCPANNSIGDIYIYSITWKGHEFLDNIRDPKVWKKTKNITNRFASVSVSLISNIASQVISKLIEDTMHLQ